MEGASHLKLSKLWWGLAWLLIALILYLSLIPNPPKPVDLDGFDKLEHMLAYCALMAWFSQLQRATLQLLRNALLFIAMGIGVEILQGLSGYRDFEYADMLANSIGVLLGWVLSVYLCKACLHAVDSKLAGLTSSSS